MFTMAEETTKRKREEEKQAVLERAAKRTSRGPRNTAVTVPFNAETEKLLDRLEDLRTRTKTYDTGRYDRVEDLPRRTTSWRNGLEFARGHFTTEREGLQAIENITQQARIFVTFPFAEEALIQQWEAIISVRADRTTTVPNMAQAMVAELRTAIMTNTACRRQNYNSLRFAGSNIMALVPYDDYRFLVPGAEQAVERSARHRMSKAATAGALARLQRRTRDIGPDEDIDPEVICVVCQETFQAGETVIEMRCDHVFHEDCVQGWLSTRVPKCPVCRKSISDESAAGSKASGDGEAVQAEGADDTAGKLAKLQTFDDILEPQRGRERVQRCFLCRMLLCFGTCGDSSGGEQ